MVMNVIVVINNHGVGNGYECYSSNHAIWLYNCQQRGNIDRCRGKCGRGCRNYDRHGHETSIIRWLSILYTWLIFMSNSIFACKYLILALENKT